MTEREPYSVLVVDDDFRVAGIHASLVDGVPGFRAVSTANSAGTALRAAAGTPVDLALIDLYLPDGSGLDLLGRLECDAFVLSAATEGATVRRAVSAGALAYLVKPFTPELLAEKLHGYARFRQLTGTETVDQGAVESAYAALRSPAATRTARPPAARTVTGDAVLAAVRGSASPLSAGEVGSLIGVSRATAQRYLAGLVTSGLLRMKLRYGATGRPEQEYRMP
ncbi:response regulator [Streptomyces sp. NPDC059398]|uniref:response regulator transcription factor n=1 Tax=Streptomyces sp. NPDC059398 TaxID=3346820 RepID=UPI0036B3AA6B